MTTVYRAYDADDQLLYVGATGNLKRRMQQHRKSAPWFGGAVRWSYGEYPTREAALAAEAEAIGAEHPEWNSTGNGCTGDGCSHPRCIEAAERLADHVRRVVDAFPALTPEQRDRIAALLRSPSDSGRRGAS